MSALQPPKCLCLTNGTILRDGEMRPGNLAWAGGYLVDDLPCAARSIDLGGLWVLPGIVDLHGDGFERQLAPRRGLVTDLTFGMRTVETELAAAGITTAWLAQFWSWEGGMRGPEFATRMAQALDQMRPNLRLDMRLQLRLESHMIDDGATVRDLVTRYGIDYVVFNDHLDHVRLAAGRLPPRHQGSALKAGRSPDAHLQLQRDLHNRTAEVPAFVAEMATFLAAKAVRLGSHDDPDPATRAKAHALGLTLAEFPLTQPTAQAARAAGASVIMGAPNVVRGGSHKGRGLSAQDMVAAGCVDALASDYHYPSLIAAAFTLVDRGVLPFAQAWAMVSQGPARAVGLSDRGTLTSGCRADVIILDPRDRQVLGCFAAGRPVLLRGAVADAVLNP